MRTGWLAGVPIVVAALASLPGCSPTPACDQVDLGLPVQAIVVGPGVVPSGTLLSLGVSGTAEAAGTGEAPAVPGGRLAIGTEGGPDPWWVRIRADQGEDWTVAIASGGSHAPAVGTRLLLAAGADTSSGSASGSVVLRDGGGFLVAWVAQASRLADLEPPERLSLSSGARLCTTSEDCGAWSGHSLFVRQGPESGPDPVTNVIPFGLWREVGTVTVHNGGVVLDDSRAGCTAPGHAFALVGVSGLPVP